jgi:hypothetical protein
VDARALLQKAVSEGADDARAAALWLKLERRERARPTASIAAGASQPTAAPSKPGKGARVATAVLAVIGASAAITFAVKLGRDLLSTAPPSDVTSARNVVASPVVLSSADVALVRARSLYAHGRLAEALKALDRVPPSDPHQADADGLRREIQRLLLATAQPHARQPQGPTP